MASESWKPLHVIECHAHLLVRMSSCKPRRFPGWNKRLHLSLVKPISNPLGHGQKRKQGTAHYHTRQAWSGMPIFWWQDHATQKQLQNFIAEKAWFGSFGSLSNAIFIFFKLIHGTMTSASRKRTLFDSSLFCVSSPRFGNKVESKLSSLSVSMLVFSASGPKTFAAWGCKEITSLSLSIASVASGSGGSGTWGGRILFSPSVVLVSLSFFLSSLMHRLTLSWLVHPLAHLKMLKDHFFLSWFLQ